MEDLIASAIDKLERAKALAGGDMPDVLDTYISGLYELLGEAQKKD